jgi:hypothetical protein
VVTPASARTRQRFDSRIGFRDGAENLLAISPSFDITDPHL